MSSLKRFLLQFCFWLFTWLIMWSQQHWNVKFVNNGIYTLFAQGSLLVLLIYFSAPKLLLKKQYAYFVAFSFVSIILFTFLSRFFSFDGPPGIDQHFPNPPSHRPKPPPGGRFPSPVFIHFVFNLLAYIVGTVIEFIVFTRKREDEIILNKNEHLETELKLLKAQINPHFLFNSLNNIYALSTIDTTKTQQSISYLSDMLRYVLYDCERSQVPITSEIKYIENYIELFSLKSSSPFNIKREFSVMNSNMLIAPMLLIPFVENTFKHSNIDRSEEAFIEMKLDVTTDKITFVISNSFSEFKIEKDSVGGIGLDNVKKRLNILYPNRHILNISQQTGVFSVELILKQHA